MWKTDVTDVYTVEVVRSFSEEEDDEHKRETLSNKTLKEVFLLQYKQCVHLLNQVKI